MRKVFRWKCLIILIIFIIVSGFGIWGFSELGKRSANSAMMYGSGTEKDPYLIYNENQMMSLQEMSQTSRDILTKGKYFKLMKNIHLDTIPQMTGYSFQGHFDGNNHTISKKNYGIFYRLGEDASIKNLNVSFSATMNRNHPCVYGIIYNMASGSHVENCNIVANIKLNFIKRASDPIQFASICISNEGEINNCSYTGSVYTDNNENIYDNEIYSAILSGICVSGSGLALNSKAYVQMNISGSFWSSHIAGISYSCKAEECKFIGEIKICTDTTDVEIYGLGKNVKHSSFVGNIIAIGAAKQNVALSLTEFESSNYLDGDIMLKSINRYLMP